MYYWLSYNEIKILKHIYGLKIRIFTGSFLLTCYAIKNHECCRLSQYKLLHKILNVNLNSSLNASNRFPLLM